MELSAGDIVKLKQYYVGYFFPNWFLARGCASHLYSKILEYIDRYEPINVNIRALQNGVLHATISHDFNCNQLKWKIKCCIGSYFIISSNENHMLICNKHAFQNEKNKRTD